ncbi:2,3-diaminopropionate biosynthesis protein SbnA [Paenibacillus sp. NEAU-GSW1]|uniref:2,3-diaminopropionate biosynthesis protein SbnA n=1 Tax=Paenibacillus sp. NEAU-GSW1 TaxID=2682486 RepID=UPI0012E10959|nr:2,3-diaminopropionate biosynthesis protein SbnA [Paenibacillus sp. NEAU-GSW1]MUT67802.1 2,3-diaminopropionate biosynthesis protein SbnA [Paenibacillus sp. NEAU-GSW1]
MTVYPDMLATVGRTPLVQLQRMFKGESFQVYAKLEMLNPGGSIKDRPAKEMLLSAVRDGVIGPGSTVVESSSGNLAIGLAQLCNLLGCRFICVVDPRTTESNLRILRAYGARIDMVSKPEPETGEFVPARLNRVRRWLRKIPGAFWPNQYANPRNSLAHRLSTMAELAADLPQLDYLFCGVSTCGTLRGCLDFVQMNGMKTKVVAVDAEGSLIFGNAGAIRHLPGLGAGRRPELCPEQGVHSVVTVNERNSIMACRRLVREEAILAGGSSGGVLAAVEQFREQIEAGAKCAVILPDRGERYLDTVYDDEWAAKTYGCDFAETLRRKER